MKTGQHVWFPVRHHFGYQFVITSIDGDAVELLQATRLGRLLLGSAHMEPIFGQEGMFSSA